MQFKACAESLAHLPASQEVSTEPELQSMSEGSDLRPNPGGFATDCHMLDGESVSR